MASRHPRLQRQSRLRGAHEQQQNPRPAASPSPSASSPSLAPSRRRRPHCCSPAPVPPPGLSRCSVFSVSRWSGAASRQWTLCTVRCSAPLPPPCQSRRASWRCRTMGGEGCRWILSSATCEHPGGKGKGRGGRERLWTCTHVTPRAPHALRVSGGSRLHPARPASPPPSHLHFPARPSLLLPSRVLLAPPRHSLFSSQLSSAVMRSFPPPTM